MKNLTILIVITIIALVIGGGIYWRQKSALEIGKNKTQQPGIAQTASSSWKVFTNSKVSFKYPPAIQVKEVSGITNGTFYDQIFIANGNYNPLKSSIFFITDDLGWRDANYDDAKSKIENSLANLIEESMYGGIMFTGDFPNLKNLQKSSIEPIHMTIVLFKYKNSAIEVQYTGDINNSSIFGPILSTFKVLN